MLPRELSNFQLHTRVIPSARVLANSTSFCEGDYVLGNDDWGIATAGRRPQIRLHGHLSSCKEFSRINHTGSSIFSPSAAAATFKFILYIRIYHERGDRRRIMLVRAASYIIYYYLQVHKECVGCGDSIIIAQIIIITSYHFSSTNDLETISSRLWVLRRIIITNRF